MRGSGDDLERHLHETQRQPCSRQSKRGSNVISQSCRQTAKFHSCEHAKYIELCLPITCSPIILRRTLPPPPVSVIGLLAQAPPIRRVQSGANFYIGSLIDSTLIAEGLCTTENPWIRALHLTAFSGRVRRPVGSDPLNHRQKQPGISSLSAVMWQVACGDRVGCPDARAAFA